MFSGLRQHGHFAYMRWANIVRLAEDQWTSTLIALTASAEQPAPLRLNVMIWSSTKLIGFKASLFMLEFFKIINAILAAISMTLCELSTANHHTTPMECVPFSVMLAGNRDVRFDSSLSGECVRFVVLPPAYMPDVWRSALSRSAQAWSSYSGYLREIRMS